MKRKNLSNRGKAYTALGKVENGVVSTHEYISKDPEGSHGSGNVKADEAAEALSLASSTNLENVLLGGQSELFASQHNGEIRVCGELIAVNSGLAVGRGEVVTEAADNLLDLSLGGVIVKGLLSHADHELAGSALSGVLEEGFAGVAKLDVLADLVGVHLVGEIVDDLVTVLADKLLALVSKDASGTDGSVDLGHGVGGASEKGGAGVSDGVAAVGAETERLATKHNVVHLELPVALLGHGDVEEVTRDLGGVDATEDKLRAGGLRGVAVQVERENGVLNKTLVHHVVPYGGHVVHRDGVVGKAHDTVELGGNESDAGLLGHLSEDLVLHSEAAYSDGVLGEETLRGARAVLNGEGGSVGNVCGALVVVVLVVEVTSDLEPRALLGGHPEVGGSSVGHNSELLLGRADADLNVVLSISEAGHGYVGGTKLEVAYSPRPLGGGGSPREGDVKETHARGNKKSHKGYGEDSLHVE
mmetsp:Transcript_20840/g.53798  ORF Transcript_20840/g.53798 Transcript_20840/m.53798 type:complete len:473 (-) Transcript_20840:47-1465(-)